MIYWVIIGPIEAAFMIKAVNIDECTWLEYALRHHLAWVLPGQEWCVQRGGNNNWKSNMSLYCSISK